MKQTSLKDFIDIIEDNIEIQPELRPSYEYIKWSKAHRLLFVFEYKGIQPVYKADKITKFGRYGTIKQAFYNWNEDRAIIITLPHSLKIWVKHPIGIKAETQIEEAEVRAFNIARKFAMKNGLHSIKLKHGAKFSEHTIENKSLDKPLRAMVLAEPELAKEKLDLSINLTSHKDKVELTGQTAKEKVLALEYWLDKGTDNLIQLSENLATLTEKVEYIVNWIKKR